MKRKAHWILAITLAALIVLPSCTSVAGITEEERARLIEGSVFTPQVETIVEYQPYEVVRTVYVDNGTVEKVTETTQPSTGNPVDDANAEATTTVVSQADFQNAIAQYAFSDGLIYEIFTSPGFVTDIRLAPGETISGSAAIGDSERWQLETAVSSENGRRTTHIYVKPVTEELREHAYDRCKVDLSPDSHLYGKLCRKLQSSNSRGRGNDKRGSFEAQLRLLHHRIEHSLEAYIRL